MKITSIAIFLLILLTPFAQGVGAQSRTTLPIALISLQKIATESANAKEATKRLEALRQTKAQEVSAKQKALEDVRLQVANAGGIFRASKRAQLMAEEKRQEAELQRATQQAQVDFQNLQRELQVDLRRQVGDVVTDIAKRRGIQFVFNEDSAVVLAPTGVDLTAEVIERLNAAPAQKPPAK
jgi:outer membrane protein